MSGTTATTPAKRDIRYMTNNNEYDLNQTLMIVWGRFYHPSCNKRAVILSGIADFSHKCLKVVKDET
jgi:hypothetical protein